MKNKKKAKKKNKKSSQISQEQSKPLTIPEFSSTPPRQPVKDGSGCSSSSSDDDQITPNLGVMILEERIQQMKMCRDSGVALPKGPLSDIETLPLLEIELMVLKARIRNGLLNFGDGDGADDEEQQQQEEEEQEQELAEIQPAEILASVFGELDLNSGGDEEREYYADLRNFVDMWKVMATEGRNEGKKSLLDLAAAIDRSTEEGARVFGALRETLIDVGVKISGPLAEYLSLFVESLDGPEIETRIRAIKNTVMLEGVVISSPVIGAFVAVMEAAERRVRAPEESERHDGVELPWFGERERLVLGSVFFKVIELEISFCCPSFPENLEKGDVLKTVEYLRDVYFDESKFERLSSDVGEFKKVCESVRGLSSKHKEVKEALDSEIMGIWQQLEFE